MALLAAVWFVWTVSIHSECLWLGITVRTTAERIVFVLEAMCAFQMSFSALDCRLGKETCK